MATENTRLVTGLNTIPAYQTKTGSFTTNVVDAKVLNYTGTTETAKDIFGNDYKRNQGLYVFSIANEEVRRVTGVTEVAAGSLVVQIESAFTAPLAAETAYVVDANLLSYSVVNQGSADAVYDGVDMAATVAINNSYSSQTPTKPAVVIDGTGTELLIKEYI